jgi:hypothetical protein
MRALRHHPNLEVIPNVMVSIILWVGSLAESISFADDEMKRLMIDVVARVDAAGPASRTL